jgi:hypothetical protein
MLSPIESLPVEVFDIITSELDLEDNKQLRLTCQRLVHLGLSSYAKRYFSTLTTTLGSPSLDRLVDISKHGYLRKVATEVNVKLLSSHDYYVMRSIQKVGIYPPPKRFKTVTSVKMADIAGESTLSADLLESNNLQCITDRLTRVLKNLKNLTTIRVRAFDSEPDLWERMQVPACDQEFRSKCFEAVLHSIAQSGIQLEQFSMAKKPKKAYLRKAANVPIAALQLSPPLLSSLRHAFMKLHSLTLTTFAADHRIPRGPGWELAPHQVIACAPNLKHLVLSLDRAARVSNWSAIFIHHLAKSGRRPALESFHLLNSCVHEADLSKLVAAHADNIRELFLNNVRLLSGSWNSYWTSLKGVESLQYIRFGLLFGTDMNVTRYRAEEVRRRAGKLQTKLVLNTKVSKRPMCDMLDGLIASNQDEVGPAYVVADVAE